MILIIGGLGYIGSHTAVSLLKKGYDVLILDNLSNSNIEVIDGIELASGFRPQFVKIDLQENLNVSALFKKYTIKGIVHFAAFKAVKESVINPIAYYNNNITTLLNLLIEVKNLSYSIPFVFSSSCCVYGQPKELPINENSPILSQISPYGNTKKIGEEILYDAVSALDNLRVISLRYFNPIGAHESVAIGELPLGIPQNLVPYITQTAAGIHPKLTIFGNDYPTFDGTNIRDYIHVMDVADAHVVSLDRIFDNKMNDYYEVFNLGTGKGTSVLEIIENFERVTGKKINYEIGERRDGDAVATYADPKKANNILGWKAIRTLDIALASAWQWEKKIRSI